MKNILRFGINGNVLKTIALIAMVIDHIGFYFEPFLNVNFMLICRYIGRIAMPIFTYLVVQGFFHTKDFKKYVLRMGLWAVITQIVLFGLTAVNMNFVKQYAAATYISNHLNILFVYTIILLMLKLIHKDLLIKKWTYNKNLSVKIVLVITIIIACIFLPLDYGIEAPLLALLFYYIEKLKINVLINTENIRKNINKIIRINEYSIIQGAYVILLFLALVLVVVYANINIYTLFAVIPIALYNGERGNKSKILKNGFYLLFLIQHLLLYSTAMLIMLT